MSTFLIKALQLILALSFLVVIHELGHFTFAKIFKVRVEKFYMFFNPYFSLFRMKKFQGKWHFKFFAPNVEPSVVEKKDNNGNVLKDKNDNPLYRPMTEDELSQLPDDDWRRYPDNTEWGIGWLPLGGYCSIAGMVDETTGADDLPTQPQPWEYRAKKTWQRLPIILGGVLVNFIAAMVIYSAILFHWGEEYIPISNAEYGFNYAPVLVENGFQQGDKILKIGNKQPDTRSDVVEWLIVDGQKEVTVARNTDTITLTMPDDLPKQVLASGANGLFDFRYPFVVESVIENSPASLAGLEQGDSIVSINDIPTPAFQDVQAELMNHPCQNITIGFYRNGELQQTETFIGDEAKLGVYTSPLNYLQTKKIEFGFWESIPAGINYGWNTLVSYIKQFKLVFTKEGAQSIGGFGAIGSLFPSAWDWHSWWLMTAFLSIILAFMNIIPIPGLDGGHVFFLLWEMITGKKPGDKFLEIANNIGFWLLMLLLIYANMNDIIKHFF